jgi:hypothetical protein
MGFYKSLSNLTSSVVVIALLATAPADSMAFGAKKPTPAPAPTPPPAPAPSPTPPTPPAPSPHPEVDYFQQGRRIDGHFNRSELTRTRAPASHRTDSCQLQHVKDTFSESIGFGVDQAMRLRHQDLSYIATPTYDPYKIYVTNPTGVSFTSHPMCAVNEDLLRTILSTNTRAPRMPSATTINRLNEFVNRYNGLRNKVLQGDAEARVDLKEFWARFMGCLAYVESLGDADVPRSDNLARQYAPSDYTRPQGVNFYYDQGQPIASALNIGLFQFAPGSNGNIQSCIREWNKEFSNTCAVDRRASDAEMIRTLGSARQAFNGFCGTNMILNTFYTQVNTQTAYGTHPANVLSSGALKAAKDRCVSLHVRTGRAYNHFGPLHNSTGSNLEKLMKCSLSN